MDDHQSADRWRFRKLRRVATYLGGSKPPEQLILMLRQKADDRSLQLREKL